MSKIQYQPTNNQKMSATQEVLYNKEFKQADIAGGFHRERAKVASKKNRTT